MLHARMCRLVALGLLASACFTSTFVLNRAMCLEGGHWLWNASLRYLYMPFFLGFWIAVSSGPSALAEVFRTFARHWKFWLLAGTIGFGGGYAAICFSSAYAPAWIVASTWQTTLLFTPITLRWFGKKVPWKGIAPLGLIAAGTVLVNLERFATAGLHDLLLGALPVLVSAVSFPLGNQFVGEAKSGGHARIPHIRSAAMESAPARVLLMALGSLPFWILLLLVVRPPQPSAGQFLQTGLIALFAGVIGMSVFFSARHSAAAPYEIAAVDATQAGETLFALAAETLFLAGPLPHILGVLGLILIAASVVCYATRAAHP